MNNLVVEHYFPDLNSKITFRYSDKDMPDRIMIQSGITNL